MAMYPQAYDRIRTEPEVLDADMTPADIVDTLKRLHFTSGTLIKLDKDVRDYLVRIVTRKPNGRDDGGFATESGAWQRLADGQARHRRARLSAMGQK